MKVLLSAMTFLLLLGVNCQASDFTLTLNDDSVQAMLSQAITENELGDSVIEGRVLYDEDRETLIGSVGFGVVGRPGNVEGLHMGARIVSNFGRLDELDLVTVGLGVNIDYLSAQLRGVGLHGRFQFAPELLCFEDSEGFMEVAGAVSYALSPRASLLLEYQNTEIDFDGFGDRRADNSLRVGVRFYY